MLTPKMGIGEKVHSLREKKQLSLEQLAEKSGISRDSLMALEKQLSTPPLGQIVSLATALQVSVGEIMEDEADAPFCIVRSDNRKSVTRFDSSEKASGGYRYQSLGDKKQNRHMEPFLVNLSPADKQQAQPNQHLGEEILFILEGQVEVSLAGHTDILNPGDSIYYDSNLPHLVRCYGDEPASLFAVIYAQKEMLIF